MGTTVSHIIIALAAFAGMEAVAWLTHKYIMHGLLWSLHRDHHQKEQGTIVEHNDLFFLLFALPGIAALLIGLYGHYPPLLFVGIGISAYGLCYFLVHDIFIHQRIRVFRRTDNWYLTAIRRAHKAHHKHLNKEEGECFGMLWVPFKYFRKIRSEQTKPTRR